MKNQWKLILSIIILIIVVMFAIQNTASVSVNFIVAEFSVPLVLVILLSLLMGVIVGLVGSYSAISTLRKERNTLNKEVAQVKETKLRDVSDKEMEITNLRSQIKELKAKNQNTLRVDELEPNLETTNL